MAEGQSEATPGPSTAAAERPPSDILGCAYVPESADPPVRVGPPEFTFETDHEALRGNPDYRALLQTLSRLQAQKRQAVLDIDALLTARDRALSAPLALVERLQSGLGLNLPGPQVLARLPDIDWEKYQVADPTLKRPETRPGKGANGVQPGGGPGPPPNLVVRGRVFEDHKPRTFNQPWTAEEQRRLEELLHQFPSEDVEMERWKKIAQALGNRTAIQVQSRTQKYFQKLQKAGLPIPGKSGQPRYRYVGKSRSGRKKFNLIQQKNSTFFPNLAPNVKMNEEEDEDDGPAYLPPPVSGSPNEPPWCPSARPEGSGSPEPGPQSGIRNDYYYLEDEDVSDEEGISPVIKDSPAYQELLWLKRIRREKELEQQNGQPWVHVGFRCDGCNVEPIVGARFQCAQCVRPDTVDFCVECAPKGLAVGNHTRDHPLKPVRKKFKKSFVDKEYSNTAAKNYLDPNFSH